VEKTSDFVKKKYFICEVNIVSLKRLLEYEKILQIPQVQTGNENWICEELNYLRKKQKTEDVDIGSDTDKLDEDEDLC